MSAICRRTAEDEIRSSAPTSSQLAGPVLRRKRMIRLRVRFIKMFDMETIAWEMLEVLL